MLCPACSFFRPINTCFYHPPVPAEDDLLGMECFDQPCDSETDLKSHLPCDSSQDGSKCCSLSKTSPMCMLNFNCYGSHIKDMWSLMHDWAIKALPSSVVWSCCHVFCSKRRTLLLSWSYFHLPFSMDWPSRTMPTPWLWIPFWFSRTASRAMREYISIHHKLSSFGYSMRAAQIRQDTDRECEKKDNQSSSYIKAEREGDPSVPRFDFYT